MGVGSQGVVGGKRPNVPFTHPTVLIYLWRFSTTPLCKIFLEKFSFRVSSWPTCRRLFVWSMRVNPSFGKPFRFDTATGARDPRETADRRGDQRYLAALAIEHGATVGSDRDFQRFSGLAFEGDSDPATRSLGRKGAAWMGPSACASASSLWLY